MVVRLIIMEIDWSRILRAAKNLRCFTGICTEVSESELSNSMVMEVA